MHEITRLFEDRVLRLERTIKTENAISSSVFGLLMASESQVLEHAFGQWFDLSLELPTGAPPSYVFRSYWAWYLADSIGGRDRSTLEEAGFSELGAELMRTYILNTEYDFVVSTRASSSASKPRRAARSLAWPRECSS